MAIRYRVRYRRIIWKKKLYEVGEIMPAEFTEREQRYHINSRRFEVVEIPDIVPEMAAPVEIIEQKAKAKIQLEVVVDEGTSLDMSQLATPEVVVAPKPRKAPAKKTQ